MSDELTVYLDDGEYSGQNGYYKVHDIFSSRILHQLVFDLDYFPFLSNTEFIEYEHYCDIFTNYLKWKILNV